MRTYRSKVVEAVELLPRDRRSERLAAAGYNVFNLDAADVFVDLLTDSGTGAMSDAQWAALLRGDEAYAGSRSFADLKQAAAEVMGIDEIVPAHQGRGAENLLYGALVEEGDVVPANAHFDTTRAHVAANGGEPVDCPAEGATDPDADGPYKGDISTERVRQLIDEAGAERVPAIVVTITNNSMAGQPVSVENVAAARELADDADALLVIDACRFAENAGLIRAIEDDGRSVAAIAREQLQYADAVVMSGKKDGLVNVGGFVGLNAPVDDDLLATLRSRAILYEGFPTYGGMAGRDLAAMAVGLREAVEEGYVTERIGQVHRLADALADAGVPVYRPVGGHAVYVDAGTLLSHVPSERFPGQALVCELYREGGVRAVELGSLAFPGTDRPELVRLALPRRMYHDEHLDHVVETFEGVLDRRDEIPGLEIIEEPAIPEIRHFTAELRPVDEVEVET